VRVVVGLGANLGDRLATLRGAVRALRDAAHVLAVSSVYESSPAGGPPQPDYLNAAVLLEWDLAPETLLHALQGIEAHFGRDRGAGAERWAARTLDLDVLWIEGVALDTPRLVVPHPRLAERAFAVVPLLEVAPGARDPRTGAAFVVPAAAAASAGGDGQRFARLNTTLS
jgi:2-amino-4-hydroxy-6-hydroxymethyldihydropteridine diphosphokinase